MPEGVRVNGILLDDISPIKKPAYKPGIVQHDNLDDRKEIFHLLHRLSPAKRLAWLEWCCKNATLGESEIRPTVAAKTRELARLARWDSSADTRLTLEIYFDVFMLSGQYRVDMDLLLRGLEQHAQRG